MSKQFDIVTESLEVIGEVAIDARRACYVAKWYNSEYAFATLEDTIKFLWSFGLDIG